MGFFEGLLNILQAVFGGSSQQSEGQQNQQQPSGWQRPPGAPQQQPYKPQSPQQQYPYSQQPSYPQQQPTYPQPQPPIQKPPKPNRTRTDDNAQAQSDPHYQQLRDRARDEGDAMAKAFDSSRVAYQRGNGAEAKQLSNEGKRHKAEMERLNQEASNWIFQQVNMDSAPDEIDLHGLYVKEAISKTESAIQAAQGRGDVQIRIIVGKGLHSEGQVAKLKPAIEELIVKYQLNARIDPRNAGVLLVQLGGRGERGMDSGEVTRRLERDEQCVMM
ncbi:hypothetical protein RhiJN_07487 [Ceratobasidium sp. AG-Ba]|nr:hypothetical protein RhiJN_07487 [Ceratobasidium sp. AG-Ba]QRW08335.1 hypothetical protein RhiLY_07334 [Ceratobasidium sp. AG-Ba]